MRAYEATDRDAVIEMALRAWEPVFESFEAVFGRDIYRRLYPDWRAHQAGSVRTALDTNETWVTVANERVTGFVNVVFDTDQAAGEIYMIAVDPQAQRQGLATELMEFALAEMRRRGLTLATVGTGGDAGHLPARRVYEKLGFAPFPQVLYTKLLEPGDD